MWVIPNIVETVRDQSLKLLFLLGVGHGGSLREKKATMYKLIPKKIKYITKK
jgi:hypothetical protein